jgi:hypothetical protein
MLVAVFSGLIVSAQEFKVGVKAGFNASNFSGLEDPKEEGVKYTNNYKPGFHIGVAAQYLFTSQLGIETGLYYSQIGAKEEQSVSGGGLFFKYTETSNPSYLQLPISLLYKFELGTDLYLYPSAGIYLGYGLGGKAKYKLDTNIPLYDLELDFAEGEADFFGENSLANRFDFGATFGLNLQYSNYVFGLGYDLGLTKINKEKTLNGNDFKNVNVKVSLAYFF